MKSNAPNHPILLDSERTITRKRVWALRLTLTVLFISGLQNVTGPYQAIGGVVGYVGLYWLGLRFFSTEGSNE